MQTESGKENSGNATGIRSNHLFDPEKFLGIVSQMTTSSVRVSFIRREGQVNATADVGDYVLIANEDLAVFGQLMEMGIPDQNTRPDVYAVGTIQLLTTINVTTGGVISGVPEHPRVGSWVFLADPSMVEHIVKARRGGDKADGLLFSFTRLTKGKSRILDLTPEMLFGRHCAVLGTTGAGKSWTIARMVEESCRFRSKIILFDPTGEYASLGGPVLHCHIGTDPNPRSGSIEVSVPYFHLTENDLFAIFQPSGPSQAPKLRMAIKSLKLALLSPSLALDGTIMKANKSKIYYEAEYRKHYMEIEKPHAMFDISLLTRQIQNECVKPSRSALEPEYWGDLNAVDQAMCVSLINRIQDIVFASNLAAIFDPGDRESLLELIEDFLRDDQYRVLRVSMQYLSFAHGVREIIANAIGRHLLGLARESRFRSAPLVLIVDEAHQFLNKSMVTEDGTYPLDAFAITAKEGRKYGLTVCLSTQRPRDIPEGVLSQMGTLIVHRLINDLDRSVVERASGELDKATVATLPTLAAGEAVIVGVDFPMPISVTMERPRAEPNSRGPNFQKYWR